MALQVTIRDLRHLLKLPRGTTMLSEQILYFKIRDCLKVTK